MITKTSEEKSHAKFSASGSSRWLNCPGSLALSEKAPPGRPSDYAQEGTDAHACFEFLLKNRKNKNAYKTAEKKWTPEMVDHGLAAVAWIEKRLLETPRCDLLCETRVDASPFTCEEQFGTLDASIVEHFGRLIVIDYKYGAGVVVDPEENTQLIYYALGVAHEYNYNFGVVELVVIQPRAFHESGETIRTWATTMDHLLTYIPKFQEGVKRSEDPFAPLKAGDWCKFCPAATICPEVSSRALERAKVVFDDQKGIESVPDPKSIAIANLPVILDATVLLEDWIAKVREHALFVLERGQKIEGWKLVQKRSTRKWVDPIKAEAAARKNFGDMAFTEPKLLSPAQLEKATEAYKWVERHTTSESSGVTLIQSSDKRPEVNTIEAAFSDVSERGTHGEEKDGKEKAREKSGKEKVKEVKPVSKKPRKG